MSRLKFKQYFYIVISIILYGFIISNIFGNIFNYDIDCLIRYSETFLLALFAVLCSFIETKKTNFLILSTLLAFVADYFLLFDVSNSLVGIILFIGVQACYLFYLTDKIKYNIIQLLVGLISAFVAYIIVLNLDDMDIFTSILGVSYFSISLFNFIFILIISIMHKEFKKYIFIFSSIGCLLLCDLCIGLYSLTSITIFNNLEWIFYVPSQILLFLNIIKDDKIYLSRVSKC